MQTVTNVTFATSAKVTFSSALVSLPCLFGGVLVVRIMLKLPTDGSDFNNNNKITFL